MKAAHIDSAGQNLSYQEASALAANVAESDLNIVEPVMVAWHEKKPARTSPMARGGDVNNGWHEYGESHGGQLEVDVNGEYDFIFADSSEFEPYGPSPYVNLRDQQGNEYLCQVNALQDPHRPSKEACVALDDWTSKLT